MGVGAGHWRALLRLVDSARQGLSVLVVNERSEPLPQARVAVSQSDGSSGASGRPLWLRPGALGHFRLALAIGETVVSVQADSYLPVAKVPTSLFSVEPLKFH